MKVSVDVDEEIKDIARKSGSTLYELCSDERADPDETYLDSLLKSDEPLVDEKVMHN